jgi:hypothetical protein
MQTETLKFGKIRRMDYLSNKIRVCLKKEIEGKA